jgi:hypothetical protein
VGEVDGGTHGGCGADSILLKEGGRKVSRPLLGPNVEWAGYFAANKIGKRSGLPLQTGLK